MDTASNILETIEMISEDRLDIRTVTMGISLLDCADSDGGRARKRCRERIVRRAADLVSACEAIETELGIPIINKRVSVTPIALVAAASRESDLTPWAQTLDEAAAAVGVDEGDGGAHDLLPVGPGRTRAHCVSGRVRNRARSCQSTQMQTGTRMRVWMTLVPGLVRKSSLPTLAHRWKSTAIQMLRPQR